MSDIMNLRKLEAELLETAKVEAKKMRIIKEGEEGRVTLTLVVEGYSRHHDGFSDVITAEDWERILKLPFHAGEKRMLEFLSHNENNPLTGRQVRSYGVDILECPVFDHINTVLRRRGLPFIFAGQTIVRQLDRLTKGRYCMFNKKPDKPT